MNYLKISFPTDRADTAEILMALLADMPGEGFEQLDDRLDMYVQEEGFDAGVVDAVCAQLGLTYTTTVVPRQNWNRQWEENFEPIQVNDELAVRAAFHPKPEGLKYDVVITPKMSFGTGHHETTHMMLEYVYETDCAGKSVFDFGCGTAVLGIFAKMKGAGRVLGTDIDDWVIENARENAMVNGCEDMEISMQQPAEIDETFDLILANINLNVLLETLPRLKLLLKPGGDLMMSGVLETDLDALKAAVAAAGMQFLSHKQRNQWAAIHVK
ncbi:MAG: 50S ribosomal protein L11 methyltransferase [Chitinophagaceae bacterium]|nr:50S ribosomal protein L11 methyltransferase [Chitinophagaceae bacterium]